MLRVTVELLPHGSEERKSTLATLIIVNDGTGSVQLGNYNCYFVRKGAAFRQYLSNHFRNVRIEKHRRIDSHVWRLVKKALDGAYK